MTKLSLCLLLPLAAQADQQIFGGAPQIPPLDSPMVYARQIFPWTDDGSTAQVMSLIMDVDARNNTSKYAWPLYVQLSTNQIGGNAVGSYVRGIQTGDSAWMAGNHVEVIQNGATNTAIGMNVEMSKMEEGNRSIGLNIQAKKGYNGNGPAYRGDEAINIQSDRGSGWKAGIQFDGNSSGETAIDVAGNYKTGIALHGKPIALDPDGAVVIQYEADKNRVVLKIDGKVVWKVKPKG